MLKDIPLPFILSHIVRTSYLSMLNLCVDEVLITTLPSKGNYSTSFVYEVPLPGHAELPVASGREGWPASWVLDEREQSVESLPSKVAALASCE